MLGQKLCLMKKLGIARKVKSRNYECLLEGGTATPAGTFPVYVGEFLQRFVVPISYLSYPRLKIMLEKAHDEFGFEQRNGLVIPCSVEAFQQVIGVVECCNRRFGFGQLVEDFIN